MTTRKPNFKRVTLSLLIISLLNMAAGYGREVVVAMVFGTGAITDSFMASYSLMQTFNDLLLGAMLAASVVPIFSTLSNDRSQANNWQDMMTSLSLIVGSLTIASAMLVHAFFPAIVHLLFPGFDDDSAKLTTMLGWQMTALIPLLALLVLFMQALNARHNYALPAMCYLIINTVFCLFVALLHGRLGYEVLPFALITGASLALLVTAIALFRLGAFRKASFHKPTLLAFWRSGRVMLLSVGIGSGVGLLMASHLIIRHYASYMGEGTLAALGFSFRIYEVPLSIMATTAATIVLPAFSNMHINKNKERMVSSCRQLLAWGWIILLPTSVVTYLYAEPIVALLLERGKFDAASTQLTANALQGFAPAIIFEAGYIIFFRIFYAMHKPIVPVYAGLCTIAALVLLLQFGPDQLREVALCLSAAFIVTFFFMLAQACRELGSAILPKPVLLLPPLIVAGALALLWNAYLPEQPSVLLASLSGILYIACYGAALACFMPQQRQQILRLLSKVEHA